MLDKVIAKEYWFKCFVENSDEGNNGMANAILFHHFINLIIEKLFYFK